MIQGLPKDIYKLINFNTNAKAVWDNVKMLLVGSELTKEDRESQLYDEFEHFKMNPGENVHDYYVRFHKLVNDMRIIRMTMPNIQLNSKFVNNMTPEWDRFVTAVKLNKGLRETNYEQLYAYLEQLLVTHWLWSLMFIHSFNRQLLNIIKLHHHQVNQHLFNLTQDTLTLIRRLMTWQVKLLYLHSSSEQHSLKLTTNFVHHLIHAIRLLWRMEEL